MWCATSGGGSGGIEISAHAMPMPMSMLTYDNDADTDPVTGALCSYLCLCVCYYASMVVVVLLNTGIHIKCLYCHMCARVPALQSSASSGASALASTAPVRLVWVGVSVLVRVQA